MKRSNADEQALAAAKFVVAGEGMQNKSSSFQVGPRYWPPMDDTTVIALYPMHARSSDSALLERNQYTELLDWIVGGGDEPFVLVGPQNTMTVRRGDSGLLHWSTAWNSTPRSTSVAFRMSASQASALAVWMQEREQDGWEGWRSGVTKLRSAPAGKADWCLSIVVNRGTGYLADGEDYLYYQGLPDDGYGTWETMAKYVAGNDDLIEWSVKPTPQGRYWADKQYPMFWKSELAKMS
jgi:hypothetical protein